MTIAAKFGGTSVKDAARIRHIRDTIVRDSNRRAIIVSAPAGVTNQLIEWVDSFAGETPAKKADLFRAVEDTFLTIVRELGISLDIWRVLSEVKDQCSDLRLTNKEELYDYAVSRGEWINGQIVAAALGFEFVDAYDFIAINDNGTCDLRTTKKLAKRIGLAEKVQRGIVVGGFYGRTAGYKARVKLFSRGGSDITGAILATLVDAEVYENWTDVEGFLAADPRIVKNPTKIDIMTFRELRELAFMGAKVFHEDAVAFVRNAGIPIHLRCTTTPLTDGTMIQKDPPPYLPRVTGVAGKNGFSIVTVEKYGMNEQRGIQGRIEGVFTRAGLGVNTTSSIDSVTVIVETEKFKTARDSVLGQLNRFRFDEIRVQDDIALICTVGEGMRNSIGVSAAVSTALAEAEINIVLELQGGSEINVIRGVRVEDGEKAIRAIYRKLIEEH